MVIVLITCKKHVFCQEISVKDILDTSLVVQRDTKMKVLIGKVNRNNKCKVDIRKKDILGTYRIKQMKKNRLGQESNQRCLD